MVVDVDEEPVSSGVANGGHVRRAIGAHKVEQSRADLEHKGGHPNHADATVHDVAHVALADLALVLRKEGRKGEGQLVRGSDMIGTALALSSKASSSSGTRANFMSSGCLRNNEAACFKKAGGMK